MSSPTTAESLAMMKLYSHWQSSASYRVRIALNLKELVCQYVTLDLDKSHADQHRPEYRRINPQGVVPSLVLDDGTVLMQSMAIIEYLDETYPQPPLLPKKPEDRRSCEHLLKWYVLTCIRSTPHA